MINEIQLINWKAHKDTKLRFVKGTNVLMGVMGAGKSSVLDAISYALFGTYPALQHKRSSVAGIIKSRPAQEQEAVVRLSFSVGKDVYDIERRIALNGTTKAVLNKNGEYLQSQPQRVTETVEKVLKVEYDLFSRAVYSEQNRLDYFLELRAADRKSQIDELLGLDKFSIAIENATTLANRISEMVSDQEADMARLDVDKIRAERDSLNKEKEEIAAEAKRIESELAKKTANLAKLEEELKRVKELYNRKNALAKEIAESKSKLEVLKSEISKIESKGLGDYASIESNLKKAKDELDRLKAEEARIREIEGEAKRNSARAAAELKQIEEKIAERNKLEAEIGGKNLKDAERSLEDNIEAAKKLENEIASLRARKKEVDNWIAELEKHITQCPVCERELSEEMKNRLLEGKREQSKSLEDSAAEAAKSLAKLNKKIEEDRDALYKLKGDLSKMESFAGIDGRLSIVKGSLEKCTAEEVKAKESYENNRKMIDAANERFAQLSSALETMKRLSSYIEEEKRTNKILKEKETEFNSLDVDESLLDSVTRAYGDTKAEISGMKVDYDAKKKAINEKEKQIIDKNEQIEKIEKAYAEIKERKKVAEGVKRFKNALSETQGVLRSKLINSINSVMQEIWPEIYPYGDYSSIMLEGTSSDYVLKLKTNTGSWEEVNAIASGGERSIACLAMRVAFAMVLVPNLRWIILDEPTHNIDRQGLSRFAQVFNETLPKIIDQVFIITHDEFLRQAANAKVYILSRDKDKDGATVVEEA